MRCVSWLFWVHAGAPPTDSSMSSEPAMASRIGLACQVINISSNAKFWWNSSPCRNDG